MGSMTPHAIHGTVWRHMECTEPPGTSWNLLEPPGTSWNRAAFSSQGVDADGLPAPLVCVVPSGSSLFVPAAWWHATLNLEPCVSYHRTEAWAELACWA